MNPIKGFKIRHMCSIPFCSNRDTAIFTRSSDIGFGQKVYICSACAKEISAFYRAQTKKDVKKEDEADDNGSYSKNT